MFPPCGLALGQPVVRCGLPPSEGLGQLSLPPRTAATSVPDPGAGCCHRAPTGDSQTLTGTSGSVSMGSMLLSPVLVSTGLACALQESPLPQPRGGSVIESCRPAKSDSLGIPSPFAGPRPFPSVRTSLAKWLSRAHLASLHWG